MSEDWAADSEIRPDADNRVIAGIVGHYGIALQKHDSALVSFTDREEVSLASRR